MADTYLSSRSAGDRAQAAALNTLGDSVRSDIATISDSTTALANRVSQQLTDQSAKIAALQLTLEHAEADTITQNRHIEWLTKDVNSLRLWVKLGSATTILLLAVTLALIVKLYLAR